LSRDFIRAHSRWAERYTALKVELAERYAHDRHGYIDAKQPFTWEALVADDWAQLTGWTPGPSDA